MYEWEELWHEGLEALDQIQVKTERLGHRVNVMEEMLGRIDELEDSINRKGFMARLLTRSENV